jgi:hypothetical protein
MRVVAPTEDRLPIESSGLSGEEQPDQKTSCKGHENHGEPPKGIGKPSVRILADDFTVVADEQQHNNQQRCDQTVENGGIEKGLNRADHLHEVEQVTHDDNQGYYGVEAFSATESTVETVPPSCGFRNRIYGRPCCGIVSHFISLFDFCLETLSVN